jgi:septal ring-binding cell division protein DamX
MWIKDGKPIVGTTSNEGNVFTKVERSNDNNNTHILNIKQFKQENCGNYELILKNPLGEVHSKGQLEMKGIPPTFTVEPESTAAVKGKTAEFNCRIEGSPKPEVNLLVILFQ